MVKIYIFFLIFIISIQRIVTCQLPTTGNLEKFLNSINSNVIATLIAKKIVLKARTTENIDLILSELYLLYKKY